MNDFRSGQPGFRVQGSGFRNWTRKLENFLPPYPSPPTPLPQGERGGLALSPSHPLTPLPSHPLTYSLLPLLLACLLAAPAAVRADRKEPAPKELTQVGITEHLDAKLPLDLEFVDSSGKPVRLAEFFDGRRPAILTMNYSNCPMLCSLQLNGLSRGLQSLDWNIGDKFQLITVSIDPQETPARAEQTRQKYLKLYGRSGSVAGWHFLTGKEADIKKLAGTVGFGYTYVAETKQYAHAAAVMICTPDGRVSRYLYGIEYPAQSLKLALLEASEGKIGTTMDQILMFCFHYDPESQRYAPAAVRIMKAGGLATVLLVGGLLAVYWRRESRKPKAAEREATS